LLELQEFILERKRNEWAMQLAISHNPHTEKPETLWDSLRPRGTDYLDAPLDRQGMSMLKAKLGFKRPE